MSPEEALEKLKKACARREHCQHDAQLKLYKWQVNSTESANIIAELISLDFINEERYAKAFTNDKVNIDHWGKNKVTQHLKQKNISPININTALKGIDADRYVEVLKKLIAKKKGQLQTKWSVTNKQQLIKYLMNRGFSYETFKDLI